MTRAERDAWVEALRSGKYKQGHSVLRDHKDRFCCLGVYCDIKQPDGWAKDERGMWTHHGDRFYASHYFLGNPVTNPNRTVSMMNDGGNSFAKIADWIEANWPVED